jgi:hypothetical protein
MLNRPNGSWDVQSLDEHYRDCVIGGPGAFMIPIRERHQFVEAIKTKIIREIAGLTPEARVAPARIEIDRRTNCDIAVSPWEN